MAINRSQITSLLLPGLAGIEGKYDQLPTRYREFLAVGTSKMALERYVENAYLGLAQLKAEGGATTFDNSAGVRFTYNIEHRSIGLGFAITREALDDDLYKEQFNPMSMGLVESFAQTKEIFAANLLNTAGTYNAMIGADGVPLLSTAHPIDGGTYANTFSVPLDFNESAVESSLNAIRVMKDQRGLLGNFRGRKVVVPLAQQWVAERLFRTEYRTGTADNDVSAIISSRALPEGYAVNEYLTGNYAWFILTNVMGLVYLQRIAFEMDLEIDPTTGNLLVIGYERYGIGYKNPRGIFGNMATA